MNLLVYIIGRKCNFCVFRVGYKSHASYSDRSKNFPVPNAAAETQRNPRHSTLCASIPMKAHIL